MKKMARIGLITLALCAVAWSAAAINIVQNPGFEQGDAYWNQELFDIADNPLWAHTGPGMARSGCTGIWCVDSLMQGAYISQLLPTTAGTRYDLSFWVRSFAGDSQFTVYWDGVLIDDSVAQNGPMLQENYSGLYASANATLLEVHGRNYAYYVSFDDFSVVSATPGGSPTTPAVGLPGPIAAIPEPAGYLMLLTGLAAMGCVLRRRSP